jgi:hypothetical protein
LPYVLPCSAVIAGPWSSEELDKLKDAVTKYISMKQEFLQRGQVSESLIYIKARKDCAWIMFVHWKEARGQASIWVKICSVQQQV